MKSKIITFIQGNIHEIPHLCLFGPESHQTNYTFGFLQQNQPLNFGTPKQFTSVFLHFGQLNITKPTPHINNWPLGQHKKKST